MDSITSIGVDAVDVERMQKSLDQHGRDFLQRVFTEHEQQFCLGRSNAAQHLAARFAAKEAVMKLLGTGWGEGIMWNEIGVRRSEGEPPDIELSGEAARRADEIGLDTVHISLSHTDETAIAFCVGESC